MKKTLTINLDLEIIEKLRESENYSSLINDLLLDHFKTIEMTEEEIIADVKRKIAEREQEKKFEEKRTEAEKKRVEDMNAALIACVEQQPDLAERTIKSDLAEKESIRQEYLNRQQKMDKYTLIKYQKLKNGS